MALNDVRLPRLDTMTALVGPAGVATIAFAIWWETVADTIEASVNAINQAINDAEAAQVAADGAQGTADDAQALAATAVQQDVGPAWAAPTGTASRATFATYTAPVASVLYDQAQMQALMDAVQILSQRSKGIVDDLKNNGALT